MELWPSTSHLTVVQWTMKMMTFYWKHKAPMPVTAASYWTQCGPYQCHLTMMAALTMAALTIAVAHLVMARLAHLAQHHHLSS